MNKKYMYKMKKILFLLSFLLICFFMNVSAEPTDTSGKNQPLGTLYGLFASYNINRHSADLRQVPNFFDFVPRYAIGTNRGFSLGAFYSIPLSKKSFVMVRAFFNNDKADISGDAPYGILLKSKYGTYNYNHRITSNLSGVRLEPLFQFKLIGDFSLFAGGNLGLSFKKSTEHQEYIKSGTNNPDSLFWTLANHWSNESIGFQAALTGGIGYELAVGDNGKSIVGFELLYSHGFSDIVENLSFDINTLRFELSFKHATVGKKIIPKIIQIPLPPPTVEPPPPEPPPAIPVITKVADTLTVIKQIVRKKDSLELFAKAVDEDKESEISSVLIEEHLSTSKQPLLNYIFFENNNAEIPNRYKSLTSIETEKFSIEKLFGLDAISTYHNLLNIVGKRMSADESISITLVGCNSNKNEESGNLELSESRANSIRDYLAKVWRIKPDRIKAEARNLPENHSKVSEDDGIEENRRVEIYLSDKNLFSPVTSFDTLRMAKPETMRFVTNLKTESEVTGYSLTLKKTPISKPIVLIAENTVNKLPSYLDWNLKRNAELLIQLDVSPIFELTAFLNDTLNHTSAVVVSNQVIIPFAYKNISERISKKEQDKQIEQYSLILFDYDESSLTAGNKEVLTYIASRAGKDSEIEIEGFTDRLGEEKHNQKLSENRAKNASKALRSILGDDISVKYSGLGETELYNNDLPECRFYNRTVRITVISSLVK